MGLSYISVGRRFQVSTDNELVPFWVYKIYDTLLSSDGIMYDLGAKRVLEPGRMHPVKGPVLFPCYGAVYQSLAVDTAYPEENRVQLISSDTILPPNSSLYRFRDIIALTDVDSSVPVDLDSPSHQNFATTHSATRLHPDECYTGILMGRLIRAFWSDVAQPPYIFQGTHYWFLAGTGAVEVMGSDLPNFISQAMSFVPAGTTVSLDLEVDVSAVIISALLARPSYFSEETRVAAQAASVRFPGGGGSV